jgi:site-specific recombinase XerD
MTWWSRLWRRNKLERDLDRELQFHIAERISALRSTGLSEDEARRRARDACINKRVYPHLLRHSIATSLLDSGEVPIDQVQKFLGHLQLSTTQIYAETSIRALGENYVRAMNGPQR